MLRVNPRVGWKLRVTKRGISMLPQEIGMLTDRRVEKGTLVEVAERPSPSDNYIMVRLPDGHVTGISRRSLELAGKRNARLASMVDRLVREYVAREVVSASISYRKDLKPHVDDIDAAIGKIIRSLDKAGVDLVSDFHIPLEAIQTASEDLRDGLEQVDDMLRTASRIHAQKRPTARQLQAARGEWKGPIHLPSLDRIEQEASRALGEFHDRKVRKQQEAELREWIEYNYKMTPEGAVEAYLDDHRLLGSPVEEVMREQLLEIARKI